MADSVWVLRFWSNNFWAPGFWAGLGISSDYGLEPKPGALHFVKKPDEALDVLFHWAAKLDGETISSASYELPDGLTNEAKSESGSITQIRVLGGEDGRVYRVISKITTNNSNDYELVKRVKVEDV